MSRRGRVKLELVFPTTDGQVFKLREREMAIIPSDNELHTHLPTPTMTLCQRHDTRWCLPTMVRDWMVWWSIRRKEWMPVLNMVDDRLSVLVGGDRFIQQEVDWRFAFVESSNNGSIPYRACCH